MSSNSSRPTTKPQDKIAASVDAELQERILATVQFFAGQNLAVTISELYRYLLAPKSLLVYLNSIAPKTWRDLESSLPVVPLGELTLQVQDMIRANQLVTEYGFYTMASSQQLCELRWVSQHHLVARERRLAKFARLWPHIPFLRGLALNGSQAFGLPKSTSDIDLLIFLEPHQLWLGRAIFTIIMQVFGVRRHGQKVANRFCLNHYIAGATAESQPSLYKALEYAKLRPLYGSDIVGRMQQLNQDWIRLVFPHFTPTKIIQPARSSLVARLVEFILRFLPQSLRRFIQSVQERRIVTDDTVVVRTNELLFHPGSKQNQITTLLTEVLASSTPHTKSAETGLSAD